MDDATIAAIKEICEALKNDLASTVGALDAKVNALADSVSKLKKSDNEDDMAEPTAADSVSRADLEAVRSQVRALQMSQPARRTQADRDAFADLQARADVAYRSLGTRADPPMSGETVIDYAVRLHRPLLKHSKKWAKAELAVLARDPATFNTVCDQVRADAIESSMNPEGLQPFVYREIKSESPGGHRITSFVGNGTIFKAMSPPVRKVISIGANDKMPRSVGGATYAPGMRH